ncbi:MAG TPA: MauE/DoxX family redox-associated membrane protein [Solirubrobacteraceae bacterium]|nr:MauE/DoxX family redox-associated membrane protein [Solirubrobacteraceae bacterium]
MTTLVSIWLALVLLMSAGLKVWRAERAAAALETYGVRGEVPRRLALWSLIGCEGALALALLLGFGWAPPLAAALFGSFVAASSVALLAGRGGRPCACFGGNSRLHWSTPVRAGALAGLAVAVALGWLPSAPSGYDRWLTLALSLAIVGLLALAVALLALAREVGVLRLATDSGRGALEIESEGPELGAAQAWASQIERGSRTIALLAVFTSEGCPLCRQVAPAVAHVAGDPLIAVRSFDEALDAAVWGQAAVPGSPYAVALDLEGVVLAKGTFNGLAQLESVLATARARERGLGLAA